ncbi:MAG: hypothetical protein AABX66_03800 [Nanoarchaeota archaeon]
MSLYTDKRAVSEMISYVILIVIALALSVMVFTYLKIDIPKEKPQCSESIALSIRDASCAVDSSNSQMNLSILLENKGFFTIDAVYVRMGLKGKKILVPLNGPNKEELSFYISSGASPGLLPQIKYPWFNTIPSSDLTPAKGNYTVEVQPAVYSKNELTICDSAIVKQDIACK